MHDPTERAEADEPEDTGSDEEKDRREKTPLHELAEAGNKKAGQRGNDISGRALSRSHAINRPHSGMDCLHCKRTVARKSGDYLRVKSVFGRLNPRMERLGRVAGQNRYLRLSDNFTGVDPRIHMVHGAAAHRIPRLQCLPPSLQTGMPG